MAKDLQKPTESEIEILRVLWSSNEASVRDVHEELSKTKEAGYTNTLKLMQIMYEKKLVKRNDKSKVHLYKANVKQQDVQQQFLPKFINNLFGGSASQLVMQALGNTKPSAAELDEIQDLLDQLKKQ